MQLIAPVRIIAVLENQPPGQGRVQRDLATVFAHGAAQDADRVVTMASRLIVPPLDGDGGEIDVATGHRM